MLSRWLGSKTARLAIGIILSLILPLILSGCHQKLPPDEVGIGPRLASVNYTIQVGAFAVQENAIRYTDRLRNEGLDAYYYISEDKLHKVRFGDFISREAAETEAISLQKKGLIQKYYIVTPKFSVAEVSVVSVSETRRELVRTASRFIGCPYQYGGESKDGFDCSGLVMTIYRLNGLKLPRVSADRFEVGRRVALSQLKAGDLVFFRTGSDSSITHVGFYLGNGQFIHAPGKGKKVRIARMENRYFADRYAGSRNYLD